MAKRDFSFSQAFQFGWKKLKENFLLFLLLISIQLVLSISENIITSIFHTQDMLTPLMLFAGRFVLQSLFMLGTINIFLRIAKGKKAKPGDLLSAAYLLPNYLGMTIIKFFIIVGGFLLFIIPGIIWSIQFQYSGYSIIDGKTGPVEALKRSSQITKGLRWKLFVFNLLLILINIAGALCLIVGLLVTLPLSAIASAYVYRKLADGK